MSQMEYRESEQEMIDFINFLKTKGKSVNTLEKYTRDIRLFFEYMDGKNITEEEIANFHNWLFVTKNYKENSVQSYLVVAKCYCNQYKGMNLEFPKRAKNPKAVPKMPIDMSMGITYQEYQKLIKTAYEEDLLRIGMTIQVIAGIGLKVSEIQCLTKTALKQRYVTVNRRNGECLFGINESLADGLEDYIQKRHIDSEIILCTSSGKPVNRSNITRDIKKLCEIAGVEPKKLSPEKIRGRFMVEYVGSV